MPYEVKLENLIAGYTAEDVSEGEEATLIIRSFISSDDTEAFKKLAIDGIPQHLLREIREPSPPEPIRVDEMVAILRKDLTVTIYVDAIPGDLRKLAEPRTKAPLEVGKAVHADDIVDIKRIVFDGIEFPPDAGVIVLFKVGGKRGYFFDLAPLDDKSGPRQFDVEKVLGNYASYLLQSELFDLDDAAWQHLFDSQWFPFIFLSSDLRKRLIDAASNGQSIDALLQDISGETKAGSENIIKRLDGHALFAGHRKLLTHAVERYRSGDFISSTAIVYPRLEGLLRALHQAANLSGKPSQGSMADAAVDARRKDKSGVLLLPERFHAYLKAVYFANFGKPNAKDIVSRHSVSHGVAPEDDFDLKAATIGLLILDQLTHFLPDEPPPPISTEPVEGNGG